MKTQILAGAAVLALIAGGAASAATHSKSAGAYAEPSQPVAYSKLDTYLKTSPSKRAKQDWSIGSTTSAAAAPIGSSANTSATTGMPNASPPASAPDNSAGTDASGATTTPPATSDQTAPPAQTPPDQMGAPATPPAGSAAPGASPAPTPNGT